MRKKKKVFSSFTEDVARSECIFYGETKKKKKEENT